jgi:phospholipase C
VLLGEDFLLRVWKAVSGGKSWSSTLLIITFDEHGGCYDHVEPPPAEPPDAQSNPGEQTFRFDRFGVRVPTVLVSPYIEAGTVFRSPTNVPYDHTSILATIRDWLQIPKEKMLKSARIERAPTFENILTCSAPRVDLPIIAQTSAAGKPAAPLIAMNDLQWAMFAAHRKRYVHYLGNLTRLKGLRTPPPRGRRR